MGVNIKFYKSFKQPKRKQEIGKPITKKREENRKIESNTVN